MPVAAKRGKGSLKRGARSVRSLHSFEREMGRLHPAQRLAVESIEGPVICIAGPGTGKTQVLALRAANILRKTHAKPGHILCLTFSNAGVSAMRERLRAIIGPDAYRVVVETAHSFCNSVIQDHPHVFQSFSALTHVSDLERIQMLNKIIDQLPVECELIRSRSPYRRTREILGRISELKREGISERADLERIARAFDIEMAEKHRPGTKAREQSLQRARLFREFLGIFQSYQEELQRSERYDYEDMILLVLRALRQEDWLLASLQERFLYILVDEFQDFNGAQHALIRLLSEDPTGDRSPNLFCVGDDDQSIYRFQGANITEMLTFHKRFPKAPIIPLTQSFRCSQAILDAAGRLISENEERLVKKIPGLTKDLKSGTDTHGAKPTLISVASDLTEKWVVCDLIEERLRAGVRPSEIAVFTYTNAELPALEEAFTARGIPVSLTGDRDLLRESAVLQAIAILRAALHPRDDALFAGALGCACFGCHPADLGRLFVTRVQKRTSLLDLLTRTGEAELFQDWSSLLRVRDCIMDLHAGLSSRTVLETVRVTLAGSGLLDASDPRTFVPLVALFSSIEARALERPGFGVSDFLEDLSVYLSGEYRGLRFTFSMPHLAEGVELMTAHQSKGLEFRTVILTNFRRGHWDARRNPSSLAVPEHLLYGLEKETKIFGESQDERRVAYVAITRAREEVIMTFSREVQSGDAVRTAEPSSFAVECGAEEQQRDIKDLSVLQLALRPITRAMDHALEDFLRERIESYRLSPTALNDFLRNPILFRDRHLLMVPEEGDPILAYGNAVHHALAKWAVALQEHRALSSEDLVKACSEHLRRREILSTADLERYEAEARDTLPRFLARLEAPSPVIAHVEKSLSAYVEDIPIKGKIDRIDVAAPDSRRAIVIDYKSGRPKSAKEIEDFGYLRQLQFYALLIEKGGLLLEPEEFRLEFLGDRETDPKTVSFIVSEREKRELQELISAVWAKITAFDFTPL